LKDSLERVQSRSFSAEIRLFAPLQRASALVQKTSEFLDGHPGIVLAFLIAAYLAASIPTAVLRPFWLDELMETWVCAQSSAMAVLHTLQTSPATTDPPLHYLLTHFLLAAFGVHEWVPRLPAFIGFLTALVCLYQFTRRRLGVSVAAVAVILLLSSNALYYASEGRPYGMVMGCSGVMLLAWQSLNMGISPRWNRVWIALALAVAIASHYYGILFGLPVLAGEAVRWHRRRRIDWGMLAAVTIGYSAMLTWIPFLPAAMVWKSHIWFKPGFEDALLMFGDLGSLPLILFFIGAVFLVHSFIPARSERQSNRFTEFPSEEAAAVLTLALLPVIGFFVSKFASKLFLSRYVIASSMAVSILVASMGCLLRFYRRTWLAVIAVLLFCFFVGMKARNLRYEINSDKEFSATLHQFAALPGPIVICAPHDFAQFRYYLPTEAKGKIYWLSDLPAALKYIKVDTDVRMMTAIQKVKDVQVADMRTFLRNHRSFYVYRRKQGYYLMPFLLDSGMQVSYLGTKAGGEFFHIVNPALK